METIKKTRVEFIQEVMNEINHIKVIATAEEIAKLDFSTFTAYSGDLCIYGQMTGMCDSNRAKELTIKTYDDEPKEEECGFLIINTGFYFTTLEVYLFKSKPETNEQIIQYLKNETNTLTLV